MVTKRRKLKSFATGCSKHSATKDTKRPATLEYKVKRQGQGQAFVDLLWRPRLLLQMKSRSEKLQKHYQQAVDWLNAVPDRPQHVVLCNFDEFWVYDFNFQLHEPLTGFASMIWSTDTKHSIFYFSELLNDCAGGEGTIELKKDELLVMMDAASENWGKIAPPVFGTLFQSRMDEAQRHSFGAHFTSEADIQKVVRPTIVRPWRERIAGASTLKELRDLADPLLTCQVLDPAWPSPRLTTVGSLRTTNCLLNLRSRSH